MSLIKSIQYILPLVKGTLDIFNYMYRENKRKKKKNWSWFINLDISQSEKHLHCLSLLYGHRSMMISNAPPCQHLLKITLSFKPKSIKNLPQSLQIKRISTNTNKIQISTITNKSINHNQALPMKTE